MSEEEQDVPLDFLLNSDQIEKFLEMFESRIDALDAELEKVETARLNIKKVQSGLKEKFENLTRYKQFIDAKGFGYTKQTADEYFEEMRKADENRLPEKDPSDFYCEEIVESNEYTFKCVKPMFHDGDHEFEKEEVIIN